MAIKVVGIVVRYRIFVAKAEGVNMAWSGAHLQGHSVMF